MWNKALRAPLTLLHLFADTILYPRMVTWARVIHGKGLRLNGMPDLRMRAAGEIVLGRDVQMVSRPGANPLRITQPCTLVLLADGASIRIGDGAALSGAVLCASSRIEIGDRTLIGANCRIMDTDFHPLAWQKRRENDRADVVSAPVQIGEDCFLGTGAIVLKGTRLGKGCVVAAGAVVSGRFPAHSVIGGNPAVVIRRLE